MLSAYAGRLLSQSLYFVVLVRVLFADGFGAFAGTLALVSILAPFASWGSANVLVMHVSRDRERFRVLFGNALVTIAAGGSVLLVVSAGLFPVVRAAGASLRLLLLLGLAEFFAGRIVELSAAAFQAHEKLHATAFVITGDSAARLGAVVLFSASPLMHTAERWAWWYAAAAMLWSGICIAAVVNRLGAPRLDRRLFRDSWRQGGAFSLGIASKSAYSDIDKVMLARLASANAAGIYAAAYRVLTIALAPVQALVFSSNTRLFRRGAQSSLSVLAFVRQTAPIVAVYGIAVGIVLFLSGGLLPAVLGPSFAESARVLRWLSLMPFVQGIHNLTGDALMGTGRQGLRSAVQLSTVVINTILNIIMIPLWGWRGAAIASLVSETLLASVLVFLLFRIANYDQTPLGALARGSARPATAGVQ